MSRKQLTAKQLAFLEFLADHVRRAKVWPTYREIVDAFGYRSPNSVTQNLQALERKGYLTKDDNGYRLIGQRDGIPGGFRVQGTISNGTFESSLMLEEVTLRDLFPALADVQAIRLEVSVRGLDVDPGDYLLVDEDPEAGQMAVAMVDGEAAVCRIANSSDHTRVHYPDGTSRRIENDGQVKVLGRYAGHINRSGLYRSPAESLSPSPEWV